MAIEKIVDKFKEKRVITQELRGKRMDFKHLFRVCLYLCVCVTEMFNEDDSGDELSSVSGGCSAVAVCVCVCECGRV